MDEYRLDEFSQEEWWDVARRVKPELTRPEFEAMWKEFRAAKDEHQKRKALH